MKRKILAITILSSAVVISGVLISQALVQAQENAGPSNIQYPVKELGNCKSESDCKSYCDKPGNLTACLNFAEKNNLISQEELQAARQFEKAGGKGPGGCTSKDSCEQYCNDISRIDECVAFAEKNNLMPAQDLAEAKKVQAAIKRGVKPPACGNKKECDTYCSSSDHMEECISFGMEAGFIQGKELEDAQKMLAALKKGVRPPACNGKEACDAYCSQPQNMEACMNFAMEAGFMSEQEKADSQKMLAALKKGIKPPACKGKEECDAYCSQETHFEECTNFAVAAGFMSEKDAEMARKTGGRGPGGCKSKEECDAFCNNPDNQQACFQFGVEHGMIPQEDLQKMEEGKQQFKNALSQAGPAVSDCLKSTVGEEVLNKLQSGTFMPPKDLGDKMRQCFEENLPQGPQGQQMMGPGPEGQSGTGQQIRQEMMQGQNQMMPPGAFPGTPPCKSEEECKKLFEEKGFLPQMMQNPQYQQFGPRECPEGGCPPSQINQPAGPNMPPGEFNPQQQFNAPQMQQPFTAPPPPPEGGSEPPPPPTSAVEPESLLGLVKVFFPVFSK